MALFLVSIVLAALIGAVYVYTKLGVYYLKRRGIECLDKNSVDIRKVVDEAYTYFRSKGLKFGGFTLAFKPVLLAVDLDLLKVILIKNFDHFVNHGVYHNQKGDPLSVTLFSSEDDYWRNLRSKLSPSFTSGKMKMMFETMVACTRSLEDVLRQEAKLGEPLDIKDVMARFTSDIIGSAGFGIDCNSLKDPNCEFRQFGKRSTVFSWRRHMGNIFPHFLLRLVNFKQTSNQTYKFIMELVTNLIEYREKNNIYRKDFMHLLLQLKNRGTISDDEKIMDDNRKGQYFSTEEIAAQCYSFLLGGFETSSGLMTFALLELAQHQELQDKLREEIRRVLKKHGAMTYAAIMEMTYLDQVVNETLRKHPPAIATIRECNKDFKIPDSSVVIEKGTKVFIPIYGIQHDPTLYPEPEKFNPDRFSPEQKAKRHPMAHIPFGEGPRMCIGSRFGLLESKVGLASVIGKFRVSFNSKTKTPIKYNLKSLTLSVEGDVWLNIEPLE